VSDPQSLETMDPHTAENGSVRDFVKWFGDLGELKGMSYGAKLCYGALASEHAKVHNGTHSIALSQTEIVKAIGAPATRSSSVLVGRWLTELVDRGLIAVADSSGRRTGRATTYLFLARCHWRHDLPTQSWEGIRATSQPRVGRPPNSELRDLPTLSCVTSQLRVGTSLDLREISEEAERAAKAEHGLSPVTPPPSEQSGQSEVAASDSETQHAEEEHRANVPPRMARKGPAKAAERSPKAREPDGLVEGVRDDWVLCYAATYGGRKPLPPPLAEACEFARWARDNAETVQRAGNPCTPRAMARAAMRTYFEQPRDRRSMKWLAHDAGDLSRRPEFDDFLAEEVARDTESSPQPQAAQMEMRH